MMNIYADRYTQFLNYPEIKNSNIYLILKSTFLSEKPKKLEKTSLNVKFFNYDYLHLTALMKETYFRVKQFL